MLIVDKKYLLKNSNWFNLFHGGHLFAGRDFVIFYDRKIKQVDIIYAPWTNEDTVILKC